MVNKKTVLKWSYPDLGFKVNDDDEVTLIYCKSCREFYRGTSGLLASKGSSKNSVVCLWTGRDHRCKKSEHISESVVHQTAVLHLKEELVIQPSVIGDNEPTTSPAASASSSYHGTQTTPIPYVQKMNAHQKRQLCKKFSWPELVCEFP